MYMLVHANICLMLSKSSFFSGTSIHCDCMMRPYATTKMNNNNFYPKISEAFKIFLLVDSLMFNDDYEQHTY